MKYFALLLLVLGGCGNITAKEEYQALALSYNAGSLAWTGVKKAENLSPIVIERGDKLAADAQKQLTAGAKEIKANPMLYSTPGVFPPQLDLTKQALGGLNRLVLSYGLGLQLVPLDPNAIDDGDPATQPVNVPLH